MEALLPIDPQEDRLSKVVEACKVEAVKPIAKLRDEMHAEFKQIDRDAAREKAKSEMSYVRRVLDTILKEMNIVSTGPVAVFDVARIGPAAGPLGGVRYAVGLGARFTLVSHVSLTGGYAWNPDRRPGEGPGAAFFSLRFRDLFE